MTFSGDIDKFKRKVTGNAEKVVKLTVAKLGESLILKTPVGDPSRWRVPRAPEGYVGGTAMANWQYGNGSVPVSFLDDIDKTGQRTIANIIKSVSVKDPFTVHYITNNTPYIIALEDGHSGQAPQGMLKATLLEFGQIVKSVSNFA